MKSQSSTGTKVRRMMLILSKATLDNAYACFILANGARMEGIESEIFFTFFGFPIKRKNWNTFMWL